MSRPIEVFKRAGGETRIVVKEYPSPQAALKVFSADERGRRLEAVGWSNFEQTRVLGHIELHVDAKKPLMVVRYGFEDHTLETETDEVLGRLLVCAETIAEQLYKKLEIDAGCVDWQVPERNIPAITTLYRRYEPTTRNDIERGTRCLRFCAKS